MQYWYNDIEEMLNKNDIHVTVILLSLHVERILYMLVDLYYRPRSTRAIMERLDFNRLICISKELHLLKRTHWYRDFDELRKVRNDLAHKLDYWSVLDSDPSERERVRKLCNRVLKFPKMNYEKELDPQVAKRTKLYLKKAMNVK